MEIELTCPKCNAHMEEGFVADHTTHGLDISQWVEGPPKINIWFGVKVKSWKPIATYRCSGCGYLESYCK